MLNCDLKIAFYNYFSKPDWSSCVIAIRKEICIAVCHLLLSNFHTIEFITNAIKMYDFPFFHYMKHLIYRIKRYNWKGRTWCLNLIKIDATLKFERPRQTELCACVDVINGNTGGGPQFRHILFRGERSIFIADKCIKTTVTLFVFASTQ